MLVAKWGNSLAVRLPKTLVEKLKLKPGDELDIVEASRQMLAVGKNRPTQDGAGTHGGAALDTARRLSLRSRRGP